MVVREKKNQSKLLLFSLKGNQKIFDRAEELTLKPQTSQLLFPYGSWIQELDSFKGSFSHCSNSNLYISVMAIVFAPYKVNF